jgi:plastocyanin
MGFLVFHPFHDVNKLNSSVANTNLPALHVKIVTNTKTVGQYKPTTITATVGQRVIFSNVSDAVHTVTANNNSFNSSDIGTGGTSWTYVPKVAGRFSYYCIYHPLMHGVLVVKS